MKNFHLLLLLLLCITMHAQAQNCLVVSAQLKGTYEGGCENGKANGLGKAQGEDIYEGEFKAGIPNGKGKYTWKNGDKYEGEFKNGIKEGKGIMSYKLLNHDSIIMGVWKRDSYAGKFGKPYIVHSKTIHITSISCRKLNDNQRQLTINLNSETAGLVTSFLKETDVSTSPKDDAREAPKITNISLIEGRYEKTGLNSDFPRKSVYTLEQVTFPFRAIIDIGQDRTEIEISEPGNWMIDMKIAY